MQGGKSFDYSKGSDGTTSRTIPISDMLDILNLISKVEPLDLLLEKIANTITSSCGVKSLVICVLDDQTKLFVPRCVKGFPEDNASAIRRHTYTLEKKRPETLDEHRIDQRTYYLRGERARVKTNEDLDYMLDFSDAKCARESPEHWHPLDCMTFVATDRLGNWIGWIEVDYMTDDRVPPRTVIHRIQLLADLMGVAVENSKMYEDAILAMNESQGYLDLIIHDIGNMISPLMYYLEKVEGGGRLNPEDRDALAKALAVSKAAKGLVDNVRKLSEARASGQPQMERYDLRDVLVKCISTLKREFPSKDIVVSLDCPDGGCTVAADELIHDLFMNLLNNAVKYNPKPTAEIEVSIQNGTGVWTVTVEDHGIGVKDEEKGTIFSRFAKRPEGVTGTGMGLSIVGLLVDRYGGLISVKDRVAGVPSEGACFEVALPRANNHDMARQDASQGPVYSGTYESDI